jgi:catechol 2,3-dioxygenase-like lactoylglutathione lyase family enzyme
VTAPQAKMFAYHLGIVVHDREAACARYSELLGVPEWHYSEIERPAVPVNPKTAGGRGMLHIAFGRVPGMTFELIQPEGLPGRARRGRAAHRHLDAGRPGGRA